jgi:membrane peptidoglycan carboxypeptidase
VVTGGTYKGGDLPDDRPAAGKTGTNELDDGGNADVWFVGFTPQLATAVWIGNPAGSIDLRGGRVQGGTAAASVWNDFMYPYLDGSPVVEFAEPESSGRSTYIKDPWSRFTTRADSSGSSSSTRRSSSGSTSRSTTTAPSSSGDDDGGSTGGGSTGGGSTGGGSTGGEGSSTPTTAPAAAGG